MSQNNLNAFKRFVSKSYIRIILIVIPTAIGAIWTNWENKQLKDQRKEAIRQLDSIKLRVTALEKNLLVLSVTEDNFPEPKWLKSSDLMMLSLNKAYEDQFLIPFDLRREDYIGNYDQDIWDAEMALRFRENDLAIIRNKIPMTFTVPIFNNKGDLINWKVTKYPIIVNGMVIAIGGYAVKKSSKF